MLTDGEETRMAQLFLYFPLPSYKNGVHIFMNTALPVGNEIPNSQKIIQYLLSVTEDKLSDSDDLKDLGNEIVKFLEGIFVES